MWFQEKRKNQRVNLATKAELCMPDGKVFKVETENVSSQGVKLKTLDVGREYFDQVCTLKLTVPLKSGAQVTELEAKIAHFDSDGVGLHFIGLDIDWSSVY